MMTGTYQPGDWVIYRKTKHSLLPGPRAANVNAARFGDGYSYTVDKFWTVREVRSDGSLLLETRRGKQHSVRPDDPCLRRANLWQRLWYRDRFEAVVPARQEVPAA
jgi:hypothetical protein